MSVRLMSIVFEANFKDNNIQSRKVSAATAKFICLALADHANDEGKGAYPSVERLSKKVNMTTRTVIFALRALEQCEIIKARGWSEYGTKDYTINIKMLKNLANGGCSYDEQPPIYGGESDTGGVKVTTRGGESDDRKGVSLSAEPSFNPSINHAQAQEKTPALVRVPRTKESIKQGIIDAMATFEEKRGNGNGNGDLAWLSENLRPLGKAFLDAAGNDYYPHVKSERSLWFKELTIWQSYGVTSSMVTRAVMHMRSNNLTIGGAQSLTKILRDIKSKGNQQFNQSELQVFHAEDLRK